MKGWLVQEVGPFFNILCGVERICMSNWEFASTINFPKNPFFFLGKMMVNDDKFGVGHSIDLIYVSMYICFYLFSSLTHE